jgi:hypothetical protein
MYECRNFEIYSSSERVGLLKIVYPACIKVFGFEQYNSPAVFHLQLRYIDNALVAPGVGDL